METVPTIHAGTSLDESGSRPDTARFDLAPSLDTSPDTSPNTSLDEAGSRWKPTSIVSTYQEQGFITDLSTYQWQELPAYCFFF